MAKYRYADHGKDETQQSGDLTVRPGYNVTVVKPVFRAKDSAIIFRPLPAIDNGEPIPYRYTTAPNDFTDWIRTYPAVSYAGAGKTQYSFILYDVAAGIEQADQNPYIIMRNAIAAAVKEGSVPGEWNTLILGNPPVLPKPSTLTFIRAIVYSCGNTLYVGKNKVPLGAAKKDKLVIVKLSKSALKSMQSQLNEVNSGYVGDPYDYENSMKYGDPTFPLSGGRFIRIMNRENLEKEEVLEMEEGDIFSGARSSDETEFKPKGYVSFIEKNLVLAGKKTKITPSIPDKVWESIKSKYVEWDDLLYIPSVQEICLLCAKIVRGNAKILQFAWADNPEFMTPEVIELIKNRRTIPVSSKPKEPLTSATVRPDSDNDDSSAFSDFDTVEQNEIVVDDEDVLEDSTSDDFNDILDDSDMQALEEASQDEVALEEDFKEILGED